MKKAVLFATIVAVLASFAFPIAAQQTGSVSGVVTTSAGVPAPAE